MPERRERGKGGEQPTFGTTLLIPSSLIDGIPMQSSLNRGGVINLEQLEIFTKPLMVAVDGIDDPLTHDCVSRYIARETMHFLLMREVLERQQQLGTQRPLYVAGFSMQELTAMMVAGMPFAQAHRLWQANIEGIVEVARKTPGDLLMVKVDPHIAEEATLAEIINEFPEGEIPVQLAATIDDQRVLYGGRHEALAQAERWIAESTGLVGIEMERMGIGVPLHTDHMWPVTTHIQRILEDMDIVHPNAIVISNTRGKPLLSAIDIMQELQSQPTHSVLWQDTTVTMKSVEGSRMEQTIGAARMRIAQAGKKELLAVAGFAATAAAAAAIFRSRSRGKK